MGHEVRKINGRSWVYCTDCHRYHGRQKCKYCGKGYKTPKGLADHELICYLNPKRGTCGLCEGTGVTDSWHGGHYIEEECHFCLEMNQRRTLEWWAKYGDEVPEEERQFTCAEAQEKLAKGVEVPKE